MNPVLAITRRILRAALVVFVFLPLGRLCADVRPAAPEHWEGEIALPGSPLAILVDLTPGEGGWSGTIDIPAQGLRGFKLGEVTVVGTAVHFAMPGIPGSPAFAGKLNAAGIGMTGDFTQSGQTLPFSLARKDRSNPATDGNKTTQVIPGKGLAGFWLGSLRTSPVVELRLGLEITSSADGKLGGFMVSLDQGNARIPITTMTENAGKVKLSLSRIGGEFEGTFNADGSELSGEWQQGGQKFPLTFKRLARAAALHRPQEPAKPFPYAEEEVIVESSAASVKLSGTLTLPRGKGPHPAVVLITGSGAQDRDEALMGHRPFFVLADHLARHGIAALRFDDRGFGRSTGNFSEALHTDFVDDALACVAHLKSRREINPKYIGLIGHSEGGVVAPLAAVKAPNDIAFIVMLAGVGVPMQELMIRQSTDMARVLGIPDDLTTRMAAEQREWYPRFLQAGDAAAAEKLLRELIEKQVKEYTPEQRTAMNLTEATISGQVKMATSPWFRKLIAYDPRPTLRQVKCPVLAINGEKDLQVSPKENLAGIREALTEGGNKQVQIMEFPSLNHLFQTCTTGAVSEYGQIEETFAPVALKAVSDWVRKQTAAEHWKSE